MVLVAAGEAHSGAVDMNGSLEQRLREDPMDSMMVFRWVFDKLRILVPKHPWKGGSFSDWMGCKRISGTKSYP